MVYSHSADQALPSRHSSYRSDCQGDALIIYLTPSVSGAITLHEPRSNGVLWKEALPFLVQIIVSFAGDTELC